MRKCDKVFETCSDCCNRYVAMCEKGNSEEWYCFETHSEAQYFKLENLYCYDHITILIPKSKI